MSDIARITKCTLGVLMIVSFFLPWVAQTPSCVDKTVIIRDNITGLALAREGTATEAALAPLFAMVVMGAALIIRGKQMPLARSLVSLLEIPAAVYLFVYIDIALNLFTPFIIRYGYLMTEVLFGGVVIVSLGEVIIHFGFLKKSGRVIVAVVIAAYLIIVLIEYLTRFLI